MALSPEFQTFIETLHEDTRDTAWAERAVEQYQAALQSISVDGVEIPDGLELDEAGSNALRNDALQEVLRQHVDERILESVLTITENPNADGLEEQFETAGATWPADPLIIYDEEELRTYEPYAEIDAGLTQQILEAARNGETSQIMTMLILLQQQNQAEPGYEPLSNNGDVAGSLTPVGQELFDYIKDLIYDVNQNQAGRVFAEIGDDPNVYPEEVRTSALPSEMNAALRTRMMQDIQNGTFPIDGLNHADAERIANIVNEMVFQEANVIRATQSDGPTNIVYRIDDNDLARAIDTMFAGDDPVLNADMSAGLSAHQFAQEYNHVLNNWGAGMTPDHLIEHFTKLVEGYENYNTGEMVPPAINIPEHMQEQFYIEIYEAYDAARANGEWDADAFGEHMHEQFGLIDEQYQAPMLHDEFDYGEEAFSARLGENIDNGIQVTAPDGTEAFQINLGEAGFTIYALNPNGEPIEFDGMADIDSIEDIREFFGEEGFTVRVMTPLDEGFETEGTHLSGYYIQTDSDQRFYITTDIIPEGSTSEAFREWREANLDTRTATPERAISPELAGVEVEEPAVPEAEEPAVPEAEEVETEVAERELPQQMPGANGPF